MKKKVYKVTMSLHKNRAIDRMNLTGKAVQETGLWLDGSGILGASPDGIVDDSTLSMVPQVNSLCKTASYHLRNIARMRHLLSKESTEILVHAFVFFQNWITVMPFSMVFLNVLSKNCNWFKTPLLD